MSAAAEPPTTPRDRFSAPAIALHWAIAALILLNIYLGWRMGEVRGMARFEMMQLHKSVGITVLVLSLARLAWRLINPPPPYPPTMKSWEKLAAGLVHWSFYGLMIGLPLLGWVIVSVSPTNIPTLLYDLVPWPHLPGLGELAFERRRELEEAVGDIHRILAYTTLALLGLHVGAALKHQFWTRDGVLYRMAPFLRFGRRP